MGKSHELARQQARQRERNKRRIRAGVAGVALTATAITGGLIAKNVNSGGKEASWTPSGVPTYPEAKAGTMPAELIAGLTEMQKDPRDGMDFQKLMSMQYNEYAAYDVGRSRVHLVGVGEVSPGQLIPQEIHKMATGYLDDLLKVDQRATVKFYSAREFENGKSNLKPIKAQTDLKARGKDIYVLQVPDDFSIGNFGDSGMPSQAFTDHDGEIAVTFLRSKSGDASLVETCQGFVEAQVLNHKDFPDEARLAGLNNIYQEQLCNALGQAIAASIVEAPSSVYASMSRENMATLPYTASGLPGTTGGYFGEIPYLDSEAYKLINARQPVDNLANHFVYPKLG